eukprot:GFUD01041229.1.p1 GENE.GFUD01041229.1~~GFUD01041229.1.p1  ORF type:complete len:1159 (-),score=232.94 GFUD01041229.1:205-3681(-)
MNLFKSESSGHAKLPETRRILINKIQSQKFKNNSISTGKYTILTFLPIFLYEQFRKYANIFFLTIGLLQQIPGISPTGKYVTLVPFLVILAITALKELIEDFKRHLADRKINDSKVKTLRNESWEEISWKDVCVGDLVMVMSDKYFPADLVLLASSEEEAQCYIETANLDGETNLKIRTANVISKHMKDVQGLSNFSGEVEAEGPNKNLYDFTGNITKEGGETMPVGPSEILLRGSKLRNTKWIFGIAVYTGAESKLMMNSTKAPLKQSTVEKVMNYQIIFLFLILVTISLISSGVNKIQFTNDEVHTYITTEPNAGNNFFLNFLTFFILYNNLIPISLLVSLEMVRVFQALFIDNDEEMHYVDKSLGIDTFAVAKTSNLNEELGQIKYVFSDKTGTLTRNIMVFKKCSIAGVVYDVDQETSLMNESMRDFMVLMSICHTVVPEKAEDGSIHYNASSPDEKALVEGAALYNYTFISKTSDSVTIKNHLNELETFEVLAVIEFTSTRKRMSVVVRTPEGKIKVYIKGADNVILERVGNQTSQNRHQGKTLEHLDNFAREGLRTLCLGVSDISDQDFSDWSKKWKQATTSLIDREKEIEIVANLIEGNLTLIGATAIEDKLQEHVPETIEKLLIADIHVWMLTGDKQITAENIAKSCRLHKDGTELVDISDDVPTQVRTKITDKLTFIKNYGRVGHNNDLTLIIDGKSLSHAMEEDIRNDFIQLCTSCKAVICCRVSPLQKAEVVQLVSKFTGAITLAIGDGANDVAMIQKASVGVGVSGNEGLQAVNSADFAIGQFSYLSRLLFVHGAWNYSRISKVILYSFYKNITLYIIELWFAIYSYWSGQVIYERWTIGMFNIMFTSLPPLALGIFDKTCSAETRESNPALYKTSQNSELFNIKMFWLWIGTAIYHSVLLFWIPMLAMETGISWSSGHSDGYLILGNTVYSLVVIVTCLKAGLVMENWTWFSHLSIWGSIALWFLFLVVYSSLWPSVKFVASNMAGLFMILFSSPVFWALLLLVPVVVLFADCTATYAGLTLWPSDTDKKRKEEKNKKSFPSDTSQCEAPEQLQMQASKVIYSNKNQETVIVKKETNDHYSFRGGRVANGDGENKHERPSEPNSSDEAESASLLVLTKQTSVSPIYTARRDFFSDLYDTPQDEHN